MKRWAMVSIETFVGDSFPFFKKEVNILSQFVLEINPNTCKYIERGIFSLGYFVF
jgi:hypothetical protein